MQTPGWNCSTLNSTSGVIIVVVTLSGGVLLFHGVSPAAADRVAWGLGTLGAAVALTITIAQLRVHGAT